MKRRAFLGVLLCGSEGWARPGDPRRALRRGVDYLWRRQSADGGWHSTTYGLLRSGQSLTPLVLNALLDAGESDKRRVSRASQFLQRNAGTEGALGLADDAASDYPCYATALALRALVRLHGRDYRLADRMVAWLRSQQRSEENRWRPGHAAFGSWGIGGVRRTPPDSGHVDLSMTRHVLQALAEADVPPSDAAVDQARVFVRRCRNQDGGFFFSPVVVDANKAGETNDGFNAYGTATADGILSFVATGSTAGDSGLTASLEWLRSRDDAVLPPGFDSPARRRYAEGLRFYYADAATRAFRALRQARTVPFAQALENTQRRDGAWVNAESLVKEDDPLIATAFAVSALAMASRD
jgi:hypothetical protein